MARRWPEYLAWREVVLEAENPWCRQCGRRMHGRAHGPHRIRTCEGPVPLIGRLTPGVDRACPNPHRTCAPAPASMGTRPRSMIGGDGFCGFGHRRFGRHGSVPPLRFEWLDSSDLVRSEDAIADSFQADPCMLAARQHDPARSKEESRKSGSVRRSNDGLQPETGYETRAVVWERRHERVRFAAA
jgi:hypothetical protein